MAITEYEDQIQSIINEPNHEGFVYDFLSVYEKIPKATITKLRKGLNNLSKEPGEVYLKNKLYFKQTDSDLMQAYVDVQARVNELETKPRFIIVTDYKQLLAKDTKTHDSLDIEFSKLPQKFEFFLAWNGIEKADFDKENPADVRAAERFAKLYDVVVKDNPHAPRKGLNLFLIRVLFCLFAEDTNIFENNLFTNRVKQMTKEDGTDFDAFASQLFGVLDFEKSQRPVDTPSWLNDFPYVDGDLFKDPHESLMFSSKSRKLIIDAGELLNWNQVNPDILGSMIQAVASEGSRSHLGMHYTSVPNIMKVIKPLFLDGLREDFEAAKGNEDKLQKLYDRIGNIKFMDPACGSGNFLIITYKELRQLEIDILKELNNLGVATMYVPSVTLNQFYGIEIEDFACDVTRLSLWIAEHQMNVKLHEEISDAVRPTLPLQHVGAIVRGNALRLDWNEIFPHMPNDENYIFGNPPYLGSHGSKQKKQHKEDMKIVFSEVKGNYKNLDYIAGWFYLGSEYISNSRAKMAFVATSSITQGIQVFDLWDKIISKNNNILFCWEPFVWSNSAKKNAQVSVNIIGVYSESFFGKLTKKIFISNKNGENTQSVVDNINPYLAAYKDIYIRSRTNPISDLPPMSMGNMANDGGGKQGAKGLIFSVDDYQLVIKKHPETQKYFRKIVGTKEYLSGTYRMCIWIDSVNEYHQLQCISELDERFKMVYEHRSRSSDTGTNRLAQRPYQFRDRKTADNYSVVVPKVNTVGREYMAAGVLSSDYIISDLMFSIYDGPLWVLGIIFSKMHYAWIKSVCGSEGDSYRYSKNLGYNTFPLPNISNSRKLRIEDAVMDILDYRDEVGKTPAELYGSPNASKRRIPMDSALLSKHQYLDDVVDRAFSNKSFADDSERMALLLKMYEEKVQSLGK